MSTDPKTGKIKAYVGGINHRYFKYDHVIEGARQVGSTFKPILYTLAIQEGLEPCHKVSNSKVLYFFSADSYNTYRARKFSDWDTFSIIDSRNLVRLNKGDRIKVVKSKHLEKIYEVELLDGFEKNRNFFVIKKDLINDFKLMEKENA